MEKRQLGSSDLHVVPLCFGGNVFGWTIDESASLKLLDAFTGAGCNFIDTADVYSRWKPGNQGGESETIIGNWLQKSGKRNEVIIATKVGSDMGEGKTLRKDYVLKEANASLKRLQTDYIDLYQTHYDDESLPVEEVLEAYAELVKTGKVRWTGTSNMSAERLQQSLTVSQEKQLPTYQTLQPEYNLYARKQFEQTYKQICLDNGISVIPYYSLASGFLTGKYRSENDLGKSQRGGGIKKYLNERGYHILTALDEVAKRYHTTPATIALAWLMAQPAIAAPIASATTTEQLTSLTDAVTLQLDDDALKQLQVASKE